MSKRILIALFALSFLLAACAPAAARGVTTETKAYVDIAPMPAYPASPEEEGERGYADPAYIEEPLALPMLQPEMPAAERVVIKNASITIIVDDPISAMTTIGDMAEAMDGFIVSSYLYKVTTREGREVPQGDITVRVPAKQLKVALDTIKSLVADPEEDVRSEQVSGEDVTREYTDLTSRLRNLEQAQQQLTKIMAEARRTEDVLAVYNELTRINEQIEVIKGQIKYFDEAARLSAISVTIISKETIAPLTIGGWQPGGIARDAIQQLINALQFLGEVLIWMVLFCLPIGVIVAIPLYFIIKGFLRWRRKRKSQKVQQASSAEKHAE